MKIRALFIKHIVSQTKRPANPGYIGLAFGLGSQRDLPGFALAKAHLKEWVKAV